jgi:FAD:protein FMN transferase
VSLRPGDPPSRRKLSRRDVLRITAVAGVSLAFGGTMTAGLLRRSRLQRVQVTRAGLGTSIQITVVHPDVMEARAIVAAGFRELARLEALLSRHRPGTPLSQLNRDGVLRNPPPELVEVLRAAGRFSSLTHGAFDPTVAPLLDLYRDHFRSPELPLEADRVAEALSLVDHRRVRVEDSEVRFERSGMSLTLDGIGKGYVVDRTSAALVRAGAERVIVEAGGDLATVGEQEPGSPWVVGVQGVPEQDHFLGYLQLSGQGAATSGDYAQTFTPDRSLHHILDPRTGGSPVDASGVTVVAPTAMEADALSTAVLVMGPVEGLALLERLDRVEGLIITKARETLRTPGFPSEPGHYPLG